MSLGTARALAALYFILSLLSTTWPGMLPFARVEPMILGLPFSMAWVALWLAGSLVVLWLLDLVERRYRDSDGGEG
jgi:TRAP-type C4-dicarboxylate transport system permease small subunit